ncbi:MAG: helix-turn-helix domain-containing protein [Bryobacteraceae bacterium]|jgi:excisionase family DNA binding protein
MRDVPQRFLTTKEVARWLGVVTRTICLWAECEELPAVKVGRQWRFREGDVTLWLQRAPGFHERIERDNFIIRSGEQPPPRATKTPLGASGSNRR